MPTAIPPHLSEANFRKWESTLLDALAHQSVRATLPDTAPTTVAAQIRNAIRSLRLYQWSSVLDSVKVAALEVVQRDTNVFVRCRNTNAPTLATSAAALTVSNPSNQVLNAICVLLHNQLLESALITNVSSMAAIQPITDNYDVVVNDMGNNTYRII